MRIVNFYIGRVIHVRAFTTFISLAIFTRVKLNSVIRFMEQDKGS